jgi:ABC-type phosphate transport system substrate-binding protein
MKRLTIAVLLIIFAAINVEAQVSVIANKSVTESSLASNKVASIYSLETTKWSNGNKIVVFDNNGDSKPAFYSGIGKDQLAIKKEWMKKQLTGEAKAPEALGSDSDVIAKVSSTPGAIGFVKSSSVTSSVKVLLEIK